jgi:hypothetical protein
MPIANMRAVSVATYVCIACGYMEHYVDDPNGLRKIAEKWHKVHHVPLAPSRAPVTVLACTLEGKAA